MHCIQTVLPPEKMIHVHEYADSVDAVGLTTLRAYEEAEHPGLNGGNFARPSRRIQCILERLRQRRRRRLDWKRNVLRELDKCS